MIDTFSILLSHALLLVGCWRMLSRPGLDDERQASPKPFGGHGTPGDA